MRLLASGVRDKLKNMPLEELEAYIRAMGLDGKRIERILQTLKGLPLDDLADRINIVEGAELPDSGLSDEIMHVVAGKRLLEADRYRNNVYGEGITMDPAVRVRIVDFLKSLDPAIPTDDPEVLEKILNGLVAVKIKAVDFNEITEWREAQDEVLRSL